MYLIVNIIEKWNSRYFIFIVYKKKICDKLSVLLMCEYVCVVGGGGGIEEK